MPDAEVAVHEGRNRSSNLRSPSSRVADRGSQRSVGAKLPLPGRLPTVRVEMSAVVLGWEAVGLLPYDQGAYMAGSPMRADRASSSRRTFARRAPRGWIPTARREGRETKHVKFSHDAELRFTPDRCGQAEPGATVVAKHPIDDVAYGPKLASSETVQNVAE